MIPKVAQVLVFSHDARFLKEMADKAHNVQIKSLKLNPIGETTEICELDLAEMLKVEVRVLVDILQSYYAGSGRLLPRDVIQKIRPLLEAYAGNSAITLFEPNAILSEILSGIRATGDTHPLCAFIRTSTTSTITRHAITMRTALSRASSTRESCAAM